MKLTKLQKMTTVIIGASLFTLPLMAIAKPLSIHNQTKGALRICVNHHCSNDFGVLDVHMGKTVGEAALEKLCERSADNCLVKIYKLNDDSDKEIGYFMFDTKTGLKDHFQSAAPYVMTLSYTYNLVSIIEAM